MSWGPYNRALRMNWRVTPRMVHPKLPIEMTDLELIQEWNCIDCDVNDDVRTEALAGEMGRREIDF